MGFLIRLRYIVWGWIILYPVCYKTIGKELLPQKYFYYDNAEDGFTGNKRKTFGKNRDTGWYDDYLGIKVEELSKFKQAWYAYKWCAWRNPAWNLRFHKKVSVNISDHTEFIVEGNTRKHDWKEGYQWYNTIFTSRDKKYKSYFRLIPITKNKSLYLRWGWKIYPEFEGNMPINKRRSIQAISIRIRGRQ
jgi:hypothetical protein